MTTTCIDRDGQIVSDETRAAAKQTIQGNARSHYVRATTSGQLFNPLDATASLTERDKERGGPRFVLRLCSETAYQRYVEFLGTRNKASLLVAERAFINDPK